MPRSSAQIDAAYRDLGGGPVAVRSSATGEDGAVTSFAGQQETILGVEGDDALHQAIERCWASLDGERAVAYRKQQGVRDDDLAMAVVVQRLVPAEVAGVLFTRDPLDVTDRQMLVEASWGLGESVVSGKVTPDRYHLDRETGKVINQHIAVKTVQITPHGEAAGARRQSRISRLPGRSAACATWPSWAGRSRRSTASRATSNGPSRTGNSGCCRRGRSPRAARPSANRCAARRSPH